MQKIEPIGNRLHAYECEEAIDFFVSLLSTACCLRISSAYCLLLEAKCGPNLYVGLAL